MSRKRTKIRIGDPVSINHFLERKSEQSENKSGIMRKWVRKEFRNEKQGIYVGKRVVSDGIKLISPGQDRYRPTNSRVVYLVALNHKQAVYAEDITWNVEP